MKSLFKKINILFIMTIVFVTFFVMPTYCIWGKTEKGGIYWVEPNGTIAFDGWKLIDDDSDGVGYYYYFNKNGFILLDDITPDYKIVGADGRRLNYDGTVETVEIQKIEYDSDKVEAYSEEILAQVKADQDVTTVTRGIISSGLSIIAKDPTVNDGPKPSDNIIDYSNPDGTARYILGPNVVLKTGKEKTAYHDPAISKHMNEYIKSGDKYSKKVNGTIYNKNKWKDAMALKGTGATIVFENPQNNFNKLKGRIATHYFTYSDRTTICTLYIFNEDDGEELFQTSDFNYNGGTFFECSFPKKSSAIRFELEVSGQYTSRVCYLRNCEFGFDKAAYEDELYEDDIEAEYRRRVGTQSDVDYEEEEDEDLLSHGDIPVEGEDPGARYRRLNNISDDEYWASLKFDDDDDIPAAIRASVSEARKRLEAQAEERDKVTGPAFDENLINATMPVGPDGSRMIIEGNEGG